VSPSEDAHPDGGQPANEPELFGGATGETMSRRERFQRSVDVRILAPLRVAWEDWRTKVGTLIILAYIAMGTVAVWWVPVPTNFQSDKYLQPLHDGWLVFTEATVFGVTIPAVPELVAPLGADGLGKPLGAQIIHATPAMLIMITAGAIVSMGFATVVGIGAGYKGGRIDKVLMFFTDIFLTIPALPLVIVIAAIYPPKDPVLVGTILAIDNWPGLARALRSQVLTIRQNEYVEAARAMGIPTGRILEKDILPQLMPYVLISSAGAARKIIFESVALYFLGILPFTAFNWGVMMNLARAKGSAVSVPSHAHWLYLPLLAIMFLSFGLILFSQGMDRVSNVRLRARHAKQVGGEEEESIMEP